MRINVLLGSALLFSLVARSTQAVSDSYDDSLSDDYLDSDDGLYSDEEHAASAVEQTCPAPIEDELTALWRKELQADINSPLLTELIKARPTLIHTKNEQGETALESYFKKCHKAVHSDPKSLEYVKFSVKETATINELMQVGFANVTLDTFVRLTTQIKSLETLRQALHFALIPHQIAHFRKMVEYFEVKEDASASSSYAIGELKNVQRMAKLCAP
jgi:hypothetical protein